MVENKVSSEVISACRSKLLKLKSELFNRARMARFEFLENDKVSGDEADQTAAQLFEDANLVTQTRLRVQLLEIEFALARIEKGSFGICEETDEAIETERLLAVPWTTLSIEGAEIREAMSHRFVQKY